jgi:hypothetical protein
MEQQRMNNCEICGDPMPQGEEMFKFHGYSGPCPRRQVPLPKAPSEAHKLAKDLEADWANTLAHAAAGRGPDDMMRRTVERVIAYLREQR